MGGGGQDLATEIYRETKDPPGINHAFPQTVNARKYPASMGQLSVRR